ncbi:glycosyltransferase family 4 protein [bacterium]|nr:glycosyltransferase family 4 protein [Candidatus Woesearchaeota archaeon]MBT4894467.1 glycosyltransferase family 4 protein [bacterium]MBT6048112.1 glycosyltransferase family 4 protein [Candidatus Scalindua sp.]
MNRKKPINLRLLYLYAGARQKQYEDYKKGDAPDMYLVGLNYMKDSGIDATFFENRLTEFLRKISFNIIQLPVLFRLRSCDVIFSGSGLLTLFIVKYILRIKNPKWVIYNTYLSNLLKRNKKGFKAWMIRKAIFSADAIISPSLAQHEFLKDAGLSDEKNYYVPYGVDYNFYNKKVSVPEEVSGRYIFAAGRDVGRDFKTLVEAVKDSPVKLHIATFPRNLTKVGELPPNVTTSFYVPAKIPALIQNSEFVVIPTIPEKKNAGSDCSGQYFLLGSMSCAKAVITSARATLADYFTADKHGLVVTPENVAELREAIMLLWDNPGKAKAVGDVAQQQVRDNFTMEIFSKKLAKIFHEVSAK